jgi:AcrR family transcriptional regulator
MRNKRTVLSGSGNGAVREDFPLEPCPIRARRGRPCQIAEPERRQLLLDAAEGVFLEQGYSSASMDDIARRAAMSKRTLYRLFATKESLFAAVIAARRATFETKVESIACSELETPEQALRHFLRTLAGFVLAPRQAALYRLVIAEAQRAPEIAHAFHREGPSKARAPLANWFALQNARGTLNIAAPDSAASMLISMVIADLQMCLLVGEIHAPDDSLIEDSVNRAIELFLYGASPRSGKSRPDRSGANRPVPAK